MNPFFLKSKVCFSLFAFTVCPSAVFASNETIEIAVSADAQVQSGLEAAKTLFSQRSAENPKPIEEMLERLSQLEGKADDSDLNFDILIMESRGLYWKGMHAKSNDDRSAIHALGQAKADEARKINDGYAEGYYYAGIHLARWGEAQGVITSIRRKGELMQYMVDAMNHMTRDDQPGETLDGAGPNRVYGRLYFKLPSVFGGSHSESVKYLSKAVSMAKNLPLNIVYYAETLKSGNASEKALAKQLLDEMLSKNPTTYNPHRIPENMEEFEMARKLRAELN